MNKFVANITAWVNGVIAFLILAIFALMSLAIVLPPEDKRTIIQEAVIPIIQQPDVVTGISIWNYLLAGGVMLLGVVVTAMICGLLALLIEIRNELRIANNSKANTVVHREPNL